MIRLVDETHWALRHLLEGTPLVDAITAPFEWHEGWEYEVA